MKTFITSDQLLDLVIDKLDICMPNPDRIHEFAERLDMVYNEELDMFEDTVGYMINRIRMAAQKDGYDSGVEDTLFKHGIK